MISFTLNLTRDQLGARLATRHHEGESRPKKPTVKACHRFMTSHKFGSFSFAANIFARVSSDRSIQKDSRQLQNNFLYAKFAIQWMLFPFFYAFLVSTWPEVADSDCPIQCSLNMNRPMVGQWPRTSPWFVCFFASCHFLISVAHHKCSRFG